MAIGGKRLGGSARHLRCKQGIQWMATDEGVLGRSMGYNFSRDGNGRLHGDSAEMLYNIHRYEKGDTADEPGLPGPHAL